MLNIMSLIHAFEASKYADDAKHPERFCDKRFTVKCRLWARESVRIIRREQSRARGHEQLRADLEQFIAECA